MRETTQTKADHAATIRRIRRVAFQWPLILFCAVLAAVAGYVSSNSRTPLYRASTTLQLNQIDLSSVFLGQNVQQAGDDAQSKVATNLELVSLPRVQAATARALGGRVTPAQLKDQVTAEQKTGTTLLVISAENPDAALAADIANQTREQFIRIRRASAIQQLDIATADVTAQLDKLGDASTPAGQSLSDRLSQLSTLKAAATGGVDTVQIAPVPASPVSPSPKRDTILALLLGGLVGLSIALLRVRLDRRIRDADEYRELWDLAVVGLIPETRDLRSDRLSLPSGSALEAFALARTNLRYLHVGAGTRTVVVTSAVAGEGKSTPVWNLAIAAAMAESRVLVIEADLRLPVLDRRLGLASRAGLSEVLAGLATFDEALVSTRYGDGTSGLDVQIDVLAAGMAPPSPIALLERQAMHDLVATAAAHYDLVLIDSPPATVVGDATVLLQHADGVLVVSRLDRVNRDEITRLKELLTGAGTPVLGLVLNGGGSAKAYGYASGAARATSVRSGAELTISTGRIANGSGPRERATVEGNSYR